MKRKVSVFVMTIDNDVLQNEGNVFNDYLQQLSIGIAYWTQNITRTKISQRSGERLTAICDGYATAYTLAFYLTRIWKYPESPPSFGLSIGNIEEDLNSVNLETWHHPLLDQAIKANQHAGNTQFKFGLLSSSNENDGLSYSKEFELLLNTVMNLKQEHISEQTAIQSLVCSLYFLLGRQNKVSKYLGRTKSTISSHMKNGKTDVILDAFSSNIEVLNNLEDEQSHRINEELQRNLRNGITSRLQDYFPPAN